MSCPDDKKGVFITFEGIEGSGKSTQISLLAEYLSANGRLVRLTREPGGTSIGDQIRKILLDPANCGLVPEAELMLYAAGRAQHLSEVIRPALDEGYVVLCDRFSDATLAYQGFGRGLERGVIEWLDRIVTAGMRPDITILLDIDADVGLGRARGRNSLSGLSESRFEDEEIAFHRRVRAGYLALAEEDPGRIRVIDAMRSIGEVQSDIRSVVKDFCF